MRATTIVRTVTAQGTTQRVTVTATRGNADGRTPSPPPASSGRSRCAGARFRTSRRRDEHGRLANALALAQQALAALAGTATTYEAYANYNIGAR